MNKKTILKALVVATATTLSPAQAQDPTISINDVTVLQEGDGGVGGAVFTVSLSEPFDSNVVVQFATGDDPTGNFRATSGSNSCGPPEDFIGLVGAVTLQGNTTTPPSQTILVTICGDTRDEFDETFVVNLANPTDGLTIADGQGRATIVDDDPLPSLRVNDRSVTEGVDANFTVTLNTASGKLVRIPFATADSSATGAFGCGAPTDVSSAADYIIRSGNLEFPLGTTSQGVTIPVCSNNFDEADETFRLNLTSASAENATVSDDSGIGTIMDNDPLPELTVPDKSAQEDRFVTSIVFGTPTLTLVNGSMPFIVSLSPLSQRNVTFNVTTISGSTLRTTTCMDGGDFERRISSPMSIPAGAPSQAVSIPLCADLFLEPDETFFLSATNVANATVADGVGTGVIRNNDVLTGSFSLDPAEATAAVGETLHLRLTWVVPAPLLVWSDLRTIDLRIRAREDGQDGGQDENAVLWVRWGQESNTFSLIKKATDQPRKGFAPGQNKRLKTSAAELILAKTLVTPGGPTAPDVTLDLAVRLKPRTQSRTYVIEVAATDDLGNQDDFSQAGTLTVDPKQKQKHR